MDLFRSYNVEELLEPEKILTQVQIQTLPLCRGSRSRIWSDRLDTVILTEMIRGILRAT